MLDVIIIWDPNGNEQHIEEHGITPDEVEDVVGYRDSLRANTTTSRSSGRYITFGYTADMRYIAVVWEHVDDNPLTIYPITAYEAQEPRGGG